MSSSIFILIYLVALLGFGLFRSRGVKSEEDFAVAGRSLSTFVLVGTMVATWIGTGSIFGHAERTYRVGIAMMIMPISDIVGITFLIFLASRARRFSSITVQDILEERYNVWARLIGAVTLIIAAVTIVSYQYRAAGAVLNLAWPDLPVKEAVILAAVFIVAYTALAGMYSVAYTDTVMGVTMIIGLLVSLPFFWMKAGGIAGMKAILPASHFDLFGPIPWKEAIALLLPGALLVLGDANMYQRFFSAKSEQVAKRATFWMLLGVVFLDLLIIATALIASSLVWNRPDFTQHGKVIPYAAKDFLPPFVGSIVMTTVLAVVVSTATSYLLVPATALMRDIYHRFLDKNAPPTRLAWLSRLFVVLLGILAYFLSTLSDQFLSVALYAYTVYGTGITPALVAALVWKRVTTQGALASMIGGTGTTLFWEMSGLAARTEIDTVFPAFTVSLFLLIFVSLASRREEHLRIS